MVVKNPFLIGLTASILATLTLLGGLSNPYFSQKLGLKTSTLIFAYNHVRPVTEKNFDKLYFSVSPQNFSWQISYLKKNNYQILNYTEFKELTNLTPNLIPKTVILTFNAPYADLAQNAFPILIENEIPATIFYQPDQINQPDYLTSQQMAEVTKNGIELLNFSQSPSTNAKSEVSGVIKQDQFFDLLPTPKMDKTFSFIILPLVVFAFCFLAFTNLPYTIILICLLIPTYLVRFSLFGLPTNLIEVLIFAVAIPWFFSKPQFSLLKTSFKWPVLLFLLAGLISVAISPEKSAALGYFRAFFLVPVLFALIVSDTVKTVKQNILIISAFATSAALIAIYALFRYFSGQGYVDFNLNLLPTFFGNPNYLASYLAPAFIFSTTFLLWQNFKNKIHLSTPYLLPSTLLLGLTLYLSQSQGAWLGLIAAIIWILARLLKTERLFFLGSLGAVVLLIIFYFFASQNIILKGKNSISSRIGMYQTSLSILHDSPIFGTGLANFQPVYQKYVQANNPEQNPLTSHNTYLDFWLQTGLLGLISFLTIVITFFRISLKTGKQNILVLILSAVMVSFLIHSLFDTQYLKNDYSLIFWLIIGLTAVVERFDKKQEKSQD